MPILDRVLIGATAAVVVLVSLQRGGFQSIADEQTQTYGLEGSARYPSKSADLQQGSDLYFSSHVSHKRGVHRDRLLFDASEYRFAIVADLDRYSRDPEQFLWRSYLKKGQLVRNALTRKFTVTWDETLELASKTATQNRSMELSELVKFGRVLLAPCDITGLIWKIMPESGQVFQRFAVADGSGDFAKPAKMEWATVKDGALWVGGAGLEWITPDGTLLHRNAEWVKTIDSNGMITNYDWGPVYLALRTSANASYPGYLWHEAVHWDPRTRHWIFVPRKRSTSEMYNPSVDATKGTNLLIVADEFFQDIEVHRVGPLDPEYGFTSVRKVPGSEDLYMALKVKELDAGDDRDERVTHTVVCVFDLAGDFHTDPPFIDVGELKYEGLEFLD